MRTSYDAVGTGNLESSKKIQWTTDGKVVLHAVTVMEGGPTEEETGPIVVLVNVNDRKLTVYPNCLRHTEDGQPMSVITAIQGELGLGVCDHEEAAVKMNRKVSIMQAQWHTLMRVTEVWDLREGDQVKVKHRATMSESTQKTDGTVLQRPGIGDEELHLDECSIRLQNIAQIWRIGVDGYEGEEITDKGDGTQDDFEQEHQGQPQFRQRNKKIESDTESDSNSTHSSNSSKSEVSFKARRHSPSKSRTRTSPSKNARETSPTQNRQRSPSAAGSRNSVALAHAEANHQPSREIKATAEVNDRMRKAGLASMIQGIVTKTEAGNAKFEAMWQIFVSPQMLFDFRVPLGGLASSMYKTLAPEDSDLKLIFDQMMEPDMSTRGSMVFLPRLIEEHSEPGEQESFRNWLCEEIYFKMTGNLFADKGKRRMQKQLKLARAGDEGALEAYIRQAVKELQEVATFANRERYCTAVETLIEQIGWVTHPLTSATCDTAKRLFDKKKKWEKTPGKLEDKFCKMMMVGYAPIIRAHAAALRAFMDKTTEASEVHLPMLPWMTPEIIGLERYELLPLKYKKQRSQARHGGRFNSSAHQTEEIFVTELEELQRNEDRKECNIEPYRPSMVDEKHTKNSLEWCEINIAISIERMKEYGANTIYETKAFRDTVEGVAMAYKIQAAEYFKEELKAASDGHRGMPKPDPNSDESRAFCRSMDYYVNMDPASKAEHHKFMDGDCVEHPARNGKRTHPNCCCCSVWHQERHSPRMHITWTEREEYWKEVQNTDEMERKGKHIRLVALVELRKQERKKLEQ